MLLHHLHCFKMYILILSCNLSDRNALLMIYSYYKCLRICNSREKLYYFNKTIRKKSKR